MTYNKLCITYNLLSAIYYTLCVYLIHYIYIYIYIYITYYILRQVQSARGGGSPWVLSTSYRIPNTPSGRLAWKVTCFKLTKLYILLACHKTTHSYYWQIRLVTFDIIASRARRRAPSRRPARFRATMSCRPVPFIHIYIYTYCICVYECTYIYIYIYYIYIYIYICIHTHEQMNKQTNK